MLGTIRILDLRILCIIGVHPHERTEEQLVFVDLDLDVDLAAAAASDHLADTVDYSAVSDALTRLAQDGRFQLMEALAERACALVFERWPVVRRCRLTVKKPAALPMARFAAVSVERAAPVAG